MNDDELKSLIVGMKRAGISNKLIAARTGFTVGKVAGIAFRAGAFSTLNKASGLARICKNRSGFRMKT
jgi:hypothetical protein